MQKTGTPRSPVPWFYCLTFSDCHGKFLEFHTFPGRLSSSNHGLAPAPTVNHVSQVSKRKSWVPTTLEWILNDFELDIPLRLPKFTKTLPRRWGNPDLSRYNTMLSLPKMQTVSWLSWPQRRWWAKGTPVIIQRLTTSLFKTSSENGQPKRAKLCPQVYGDIQLWVWSHTTSVGVGPIWSNIYIYNYI